MKKGLKKIRLNRETLRVLEGKDLGGVVGGVTNGVCATKNPTICNPNSNCFSCDGSCGISCTVCPHCPP